MTDEHPPETPPPEASTPEEPPAQDPRARTWWRIGRAAIMGLLIGGVVIIFSHLGH